MKDLLNKLYDEYDNGTLEAADIEKFRIEYAANGRLEEEFSAAINAARFAGFKDGFHAALQLFSGINGGRD